MKKSNKISHIQDRMFDSFIAIPGYNVIAVLTREDGEKEWFSAKNIVTDAGDRFYAQTIVGTTQTTNFKTTGYLYLGTSAVTPTKSDAQVGSVIASGSVALDSGYPVVSDPDTDNTGSGVDIVTWRFTFGTAVANANNISEGAIANSSTYNASGTSLTRFLFASTFNKTSSDTLKVFVNHEMRGTT